jgi:acetyl-CoA C-acetyltransferase
VTPSAVIVACARTPIGRAFKGSLASARPDDLAAFAIEASLAPLPQLDRSLIDDVIAGCGMPHHEAGWNIGRNAALLAGIPESVPGTTVNRWCGSSLQALRMASHAIAAGEGTCFVIVGVESTSRCGSNGFGPEDRHERFLDKARPDFVDHVYMSMGETAEIVADRCGISRSEMDAFAKKSQNRAVAAVDSGFFAREISPYTLPDGRVIAHDDGPRREVSLEALAALTPAFRPDGRITAGNSCPLNDGAAALVVMEADFAQDLEIAPLARVVGSAVSGIAPEIMGLGPIEAVGRLLRATGRKIGDLDVIELNEAFAVQVIAVCRELGIDMDAQLNPNGGAIALGHPFGMTGARLIGTLLNDLTTRGKHLGMATLCVGGGQGMAVMIERMGGAA